MEGPSRSRWPGIPPGARDATGEKQLGADRRRPRDSLARPGRGHQRRGLLAGRKSRESHRSFQQWLEGRGRGEDSRCTNSPPTKMSANRRLMVSKTQLPDDWQVAQLGDVAQVETGGTPSRSQSTYWGGSIPWMASGEINQRRVNATAELITLEGLKNSNAKLFPPGTVMVAMNGQGATRGKVGVLDIEAACNQSLAAVRSGWRSEIVSCFMCSTLRTKNCVTLPVTVAAALIWD